MISSGKNLSLPIDAYKVEDKGADQIIKRQLHHTPSTNKLQGSNHDQGTDRWQRTAEEYGAYIHR